MAKLEMSQKPWPVVLVAAHSAVAFIGLAVVVYWVYYTNDGAVYVPFLNEGLATLQVLFYVALAVHMLSSFGAAAALIIWSGAPKYPAFAAVGLTFALLTIPLIYILTALNLCTIGVQFPIPGVPINCDD